MSRNEIFMLLACVFAAAIMTSGPLPLRHSPPVTIVSLSAPGESVVVADTGMLQHSFDNQ